MGTLINFMAALIPWWIAVWAKQMEPKLRVAIAMVGVSNTIWLFKDHLPWPVTWLGGAISAAAFFIIGIMVINNIKELRRLNKEIRELKVSNEWLMKLREAREMEFNDEWDVRIRPSKIEPLGGQQPAPGSRPPQAQDYPPPPPPFKE